MGGEVSDLEASQEGRDAERTRSGGTPTVQSSLESFESLILHTVAIIPQGTWIAGKILTEAIATITSLPNYILLVIAVRCDALFGVLIGVHHPNQDICVDRGKRCPAKYTDPRTGSSSPASFPSLCCSNMTKPVQYPVDLTQGKTLGADTSKLQLQRFRLSIWHWKPGEAYLTFTNLHTH
jgi:hypothetical protein